MKIQRGIVQWQDRNDWECLYGVLDDNTQYYFMDVTGKTLPNGNIIATTSLTEALEAKNPTKEPKEIGLIDPQGNIVIPFENKSIKPINDGIILVEKATPVSQNVIDACNKKNDPLSATQLVSTAATIKANLNSLTAGQGEYVFNDLFSEATICDLNGNNLLNGEYYSFITMTNEKLFFSKNTVDSQIIEYSLLAPQAVNQANNNEIDVNNINVDASSVNNAMQQESTVSTPENMTAGDNASVEQSAEVQDLVGQQNSVENMTDQSSVEVPNQGVSESAENDVSQPIENGVIQVSDQLQQDVVQGGLSDNADQNLSSDVSIDAAVAQDSGLVAADDAVSAPVADSIDAALNPDEAVASSDVQDTVEVSADSNQEETSVDDVSDEVSEDSEEIEEPEMPSSDDNNDIDAVEESETDVNSSSDVSADDEKDEVEEESNDEKQEEAVDQTAEEVEDPVSAEIPQESNEEKDESISNDEVDESDKNLEENVIDENELLNSVVNSDSNNETDKDENTMGIAEDKSSLDNSDLVSEDGFESIFDEDMNTDIFKDSVARTDSIRDEEDDFSDSYGRSNDYSSHFNNAVSNVNRLINGYRKLQEEVYHLKSKYKVQSEQIKKAGVVVNKLKSKNQMLQSENNDLKKENMKKDKQINYLTDQVRGYSEIAKLGNIAGELLNSNYSEYDEDDYSYNRMAA